MTDDPLIAALSRTPDKGESRYRTTQQLVDELGLTEKTIRARLAIYHRAGQLETGDVWITTIAGRQQRIPGYRIKDNIG